METKPDKAEEEIAAVRSAATADGDSSPVKKECQDGEMPLSGHLQEFRSRLIICLAAVAVASGVSYNFVEEIIDIISAPAGKLYFLNPAEVFFSYIQVAVCTGILVTLPIICYELWGFVRPALMPSERAAVFWLIPTAVLLFYLRRISGGRIVFYGLCYGVAAAYVFTQLVPVLFYCLHAALRRRLRAAPRLVFPGEDGTDYVGLFEI